MIKNLINRPTTHSHNIHGDYIVNLKISFGPDHTYKIGLLIKRKFKEITSIISYVHYYNSQHQNHLVRRLNKLDGYIPPHAQYDYTFYCKHQSNIYYLHPR